VENNPLRYYDPTGHAKASDNSNIMYLVQSITTQWNTAQNNIDSLKKDMKTCAVSALCKNAQTLYESNLPRLQDIQTAAEKSADAVRVTYYSTHNSSLPTDVKYRDSGVNAPDVTTKLNNLMEQNNEKYKDFSSLNNAATTLATFVKLVQTGGDVDIKSKPYWQANSYYTYSGEMYRRDDMGNILFGYVGKVFNYSDGLLLFGAGAYQVYSGTSSLSYPISSYFDDPRDQAMISYGISIYGNK
jgi:hypothetical protein